MKLVYEIAVLLHIVGVVSIAYGFFHELRKGTRGINAAMLHGASTQFATGLIMVGLRSSDLVQDDELNMSKIGLKLLVTVAILVAVVIGRRASNVKPYWALVGALTLLNVVVAVAL